MSAAAWQRLWVGPPSALSRQGTRQIALLAALAYSVVVAASWAVFASRFESLSAATGAWDGHHFLAIAQHGYPSSLQGQFSNLAFLPGMPLAIALVHMLGVSYAVSGFCVSVVAGCSFVACCSVLVARRYGDSAGVRAAILLAVSPGAFLFGLSYADPLALAFVAGALLALDSRRWVMAGVLGALATATSPITFPLALVGLATIRYDGARAATVAFMPAGFGAFVIYLWEHTGSPTTWFLAERRGWGQGLDVLNLWDRLTASAGVGIPITVSSCLLLAAAGLYAMYRAKVPKAWWIYTIPVLTYSLLGRGGWLNPRYLLNAFPLTLAAAVLLRRRAFLVAVVLSLAAMQLALVAYLVLWPNQVAQP